MWNVKLKMWELKKVQFLRSLGVDHLVGLGCEDVIQSVMEFLKSKKLKGVDVLYDPIGGKLIKGNMKLFNWGANILVIGFAIGEVPLNPANIALVKGLIKIHISHTYMLQEVRHWYNFSVLANLAFFAIRDRKIIGKLMIDYSYI
ncbi:hypothetical protein ACFE04_023577 [Oxalis oulophora]